jgi:hypothetical protein
MLVRQDNNGWTHVEWKLKGITPAMLDWHWCNMNKDYNLWHPIQHKNFCFEVPPTAQKVLGAIHSAPQTRADGSYKKPRLRYDDVANLDKKYSDVIIYDHACIVSCIGMGLPGEKDDDPVQSYRIHQWQGTDEGLVGMVTAISLRGETVEEEKRTGLLWAKHAKEEIGYFMDFLAPLYMMWSKVEDRQYNPYHSFRIEKTSTGFRYVDMK